MWGHVNDFQATFSQLLFLEEEEGAGTEHFHLPRLLHTYIHTYIHIHFISLIHSLQDCIWIRNMSKEKTDNTRDSQQTYKSKYKTAIKQGRDISIWEVQSNSTLWQLNQHKSGNTQNIEFSDYKIASTWEHIMLLIW